MSCIAAAGVQVIVQSFGFPQEFWNENDIIDIVFSTNRIRIAYWYGGFDDHHYVGIYFQCLLNSMFYCAGIEEMVLIIIICGSCNNHEFRSSISFSFIRCDSEVQFAFSVPYLLKEPFNFIVLNSGYEWV